MILEEGDEEPEKGEAIYLGCNLGGRREPVAVGMEKEFLIESAVAGFLGVASAAMAFAAEGTKLKESDVYDPINRLCNLPKENPAVELALASAAALAVAHIIINAFACFFCCRKHQRSSCKIRAVASITFIVSWLTFIVAILTLLTGAYINNQKEDLFETCLVVKTGAFSGAAAGALLTVGLGLTSNFLISSSKKKQTGSLNP